MDDVLKLQNQSQTNQSLLQGSSTDAAGSPGKEILISRDLQAGRFSSPSWPFNILIQCLKMKALSFV